MTARRRQWLSAFLGTGLLVLLLAIVSFDHFQRPEPLVTVPLREVLIYEPPPPPPPAPPDPRESGAANPRLALAHTETPIVLEIMQLDVDLPVGELGNLGLGGSGLGEGVGAGFDTVSLSELDTSPIVMGAPPIAYPPNVLAQGIEEFEVRVHVLIDAEGRARLIRIVENPFPFFGPEIEKFVAQVVFSPPTRLGTPVRAEYLWPLLIRCRVACEDEASATRGEER